MKDTHLVLINLIDLKGRQISHLLVQSPKCLQWPMPGQTEAGSSDFHLCLPVSGRDSTNLNHHLLPPRVGMSRKLEPGTQEFCYGLEVSQAASSSLYPMPIYPRRLSSTPFDRGRGCGSPREGELRLSVGIMGNPEQPSTQVDSQIMRVRSFKGCSWEGEYCPRAGLHRAHSQGQQCRS